MTISLIDILTSKYDSHELAHFYILESNSAEKSKEIINNWLQSFLKKISGSDLSLGHPDIEDIKTEDKTYKVDSDEVMRLLSFVNYAPIKLSYKFQKLF